MRSITGFTIASITGLLIIFLSILFHLSHETTIMDYSHWETESGPETSGLKAKLHGILVTTPSDASAPNDGSIGGLVFPSGKSILIRPPGSVVALAGPDRAGNVAFIEDLDKSFQLRMVSVDGRETHSVFTRPGDFFWDNIIGASFALSTVRNRFAFISNLKSRQMEDPPQLCLDGTLELWDTVHNTKRILSVPADDSGLSWFPDGRHLAYVQLDPNPGGAQGREFGSGFEAWPVLPVIYVLDTVTETRTRLGIGWHPVVSTDGSRVLIHDGHYQPRLISMASHGPSVPVSVPGLFSFVLALDGDLVIYTGYPTTGRPRHLTSNNSPLSVPKEMPSVKVAVLNSKKFQTIIPYIDTRHPMSFDLVSQGTK